jgi:NADH pyrophosphatase NudC (nudix superfamily)/nicotinamide mononucleotide (NMN) deamidase PncC
MNSIPQVFARLVAALRLSKSTVTVVEQSCGGLISASILAQPGASQVFFGGSVIYSTAKCQPLLLNDTELYQSLLVNAATTKSSELRLSESLYGVDDAEIDRYLASKLHWTKQIAIAYCQAMQTDYAIVESGAVGPTFRPSENMKTGVSVVAIAGRCDVRDDGKEKDDKAVVELLHQEIIRSNHADRLQNMHDFAGYAAAIATAVIGQHQDDAFPKQEEVAMDAGTNRIIITTRTATQNNALSSSSTVLFSSEVVSPQDAPSLLRLDRAAELRSNSTLLDELLQAQTTQFMILHRNRILLTPQQSTSTYRVAFLNPTELQTMIPNQQDWIRTIFLGLLREEASPLSTEAKGRSAPAIFAVDLLVDPKEPSLEPTPQTQYIWADTRSTAPLMIPLENELVLYGTALAEWQRRTKCCTSCGHPMQFLQGGTLGQCRQCAVKFWPRQDPSIIVVVSSRDGQRILLANHKRHLHQKFYTVLAGFVEVGETFEAAVAREVWEETKIRIDPESVQYVGSQPWPFPHSCMIGFLATADDAKQVIVVDPEEIVNAAWFHKDDIVKAAQVTGPTMQRAVAEAALQDQPDLSCVIPPKGVIARTLIDVWLERDIL